MLFLGMANAYIMRTNMSVAIVAMVNQTALMDESVQFDNECPANPIEHKDEGEEVSGCPLPFAPT